MVLELVGFKIVWPVEHGHADVARVAQRPRMDERVLHHDVLPAERLRAILTLERAANVKTLSDRPWVRALPGHGGGFDLFFQVMRGGMGPELVR